MAQSCPPRACRRYAPPDSPESRLGSAGAARRFAACPAGAGAIPAGAGEFATGTAVRCEQSCRHCERRPLLRRPLQPGTQW